VTITGDFADTAERTIVGALARTVGGVSAVTLKVETPARIARDDD